jgi:acetyl-CoA decarbonylase/synthase complex subunit delta
VQMAFEMPVEKWSGQVNEVTIGATAAAGGSRTSTVALGGSTTLPFLHFEGHTPRPSIAMDVWDEAPTEWPGTIMEAVGDVCGDPAQWAQKCVDEFGADLIRLCLVSADPEKTNAPPEKCAETVKAVLEAVGVPLIIWGCGDPDKDNDVWPIVSPAAAGERCLLGSARQENYKTIAACALADGHLIVNEAPLDIAIQKQVNILVTDMGVQPSNIVMYQTTGGLGYGIEYAFSIMERTRLAALDGDAMLSMPMLAVVGQEAWKTKEARLTEEEAPEWGPAEPRAIMWEAATAATFLQGGCDLLVMWHPEAVTLVREQTEGLMD